MSPIGDYTDEAEREAFAKGQAEALSSPKKLKRSEVKAMSTREAADRMPEIREAMDKGFEPEDDDED
jgi:hypothetical protein